MARITAVVVTIAIVAIALVFMVFRIGAVVGWEQASSAWPLIALLTIMLLVIGWFIFIAVRNKLER